MEQRLRVGRKAGRGEAVRRAAQITGQHVWVISTDPKRTGCALCGPAKVCPVNEPFTWTQRRRE